MRSTPVIAMARRWFGRRRDVQSVARLPAVVLLPVLSLTLVIAFVLNVGSGAVSITPEQVVAIIAHHAGVDLGIAFNPQQDAILWAIRLPRVVMAALVGSALAASGALLQGLFRNPLADPGLVGISGGAALGAVSVSAIGVSWLGSATDAAAAAIAAVLTATAVYLVSRNDGRTEAATLILSGIAFAMFLGAGASLLTYVFDDQGVRNVSFWSFGSVGGATWEGVATLAPCVVIGLVLASRVATPLNLMVLGEREAWHLGVDVERARWVIIVLAAVLAGATVAFAGVVGFVGLIVPHLVRLVSGPNHRLLLPASALGGATLVLLADLAARTMIAPVEVPLGIVTALLGGPALVLLLRRNLRARGGW